ncbi:polyhydroxyalkanoate biosynthesis repressor PhaR [Gottfriedia acidiceleris]|uniref:polyhydroxyalkanoate biosynthesis repressor PhaR n=1 Tax=Gottfriedia acidiceleris TaxID=371036 RepID=UPI003D1CCBA6
MSEQRTFNPFDFFTKLTAETEKQLNELIGLRTNNREFMQFSNTISDSSALFQEKFKKSKEAIETHLNLPSKNDLVNITKLSIQTEEKLDALEEQIWELNKLVNSNNKEIEGIVEVSNDIIKLSKHLKTEISKSKSEFLEINKLRLEIQEMKKELAGISSLKAEISSLFDMMLQNVNKPAVHEGELVLTKG